MLSTKLKNMVNKVQKKAYRLSRLQRRVIAGECLVCKQPVKTAHDLCLDCYQQLVINSNACIQCAEPLPSNRANSLCARCQKQPPAFDQVFAPFIYTPPLDALLLNFKKTAQRTAGSLIVDLLSQKLQSQSEIKNAELLVAIPGQKNRLRERGIDPPSWLAQRLAWQLDRPFLPQGLIRCRNLTSQQALSRKKRWLNPQGAFLASPQVAGQSILLIDDVVTTGATCHWAANELKEKGAASVIVIAAARTPF